MATRSRSAFRLLGAGVGGVAIVVLATCATRGRAPAPAHWTPAAPETQNPGTSKATPPPPALPNSDQDSVEQRFGFSEGKARRETADKDARSTGSAPTSQNVVPMPPGSPTPAAARPPLPPDAGARDPAVSPLAR